MTFLIIWALAFFGFWGSSSGLFCKPEENEILFMDRCWCRPGWESSVKRPSLKCDKPVENHGDCHCGPKDRHTGEVSPFKDSMTWNRYLDDKNLGGGNYNDVRCYNLCRYNSEAGVPIAHPLEWKDNLYWKQIGFYTKELRICSFNLRHTHMRQRLDEFYESYDNFTFMYNYKSATGGKGLGRVVEFGAGGYTQTRNLLEHVNITVEHVTLVDPLIWPYGKLEGCSYRGGTLKVNNSAYPTTLANVSTETFGKRYLGENILNQTPLDFVVPNATLFDTVIVMNVLVYSANAFEFLETIYRVLKPGGLLLFHDRYFLDMVKSSRCKTAGFQSHMIQVKKDFLDFFLSHFEHEPFLNTKQNSLQKDRSWSWCGNQDFEIGYFVAVRKRGGNLRE